MDNSKTETETELKRKLSYEAKWAEIDLDALAYNMKNIRSKVGNDRRIAAVVKANAYGHGVLPVVSTLLENGADQFAVSSLNEALELRKAVPERDIIVLGNIPYGSEEVSVNAGIQHTVTSFDKAKLLSDAAVKLGKKARIHIKLDTGMTRIGFQMNEDGIAEVLEISKLPRIDMEGIFTHFARADEVDKQFADRQYERYQWFVGKLEIYGISFKIKHVSNSAAIMEMPETYKYGAFGEAVHAPDVSKCKPDGGEAVRMVRPGIILYGIYPSGEVDRNQLDIKPVMSFKTRIAHIKRLPEDRQVSYGGKYTAHKGDVIGTIAVGYADGYSRAQSGKAEVLYRGQRVKVIGNICMDQCMIDLSAFPDAEVGDEIVLIGSSEADGLMNTEYVCSEYDSSGNPLGGCMTGADGRNADENVSSADAAFIDADEVAARYNTIGYEVVCAVNRRVPRYYIKDGKLVSRVDYLE